MHREGGHLAPARRRAHLISLEKRWIMDRFLACGLMSIPVKTSPLEICPVRGVPLRERLLRLFAPFLIGGFYILLLFLFLPSESALLVGGLMLAYLVPPAGKESIVPLGIALGIPWWLITFSIGLMDVLAGIFMALNCDVAFKIPLLGRWIAHFLEKGNEFVSRRPWLERFYFTGVVLFVMFPLQGSGGIGGSLVGWMIGLSPARTLLAITIGAFLGCAAIALGSQAIKEIFLLNVTAGIAAIVIVVAVLILSYALYRKRILR